MKSVQRMCAVCRSMKDKEMLLRVAVDKSGAVAVDLSGKLGGRGAYICKDGVCKDRFIKSRALERALHCEISQEIKENIIKELI